MNGRVVFGVDGWKGRWVAVTLIDGHFASAALFTSVAELAQADNVEVIGIDIPIGLPEVGGQRKADLLARKAIGLRASSVFITPSQAEFDADNHAAAVAIARAASHPAMSIQAWGLRRAIAEVALVAVADSRIHEIHPEVSFVEMAGAPLRWPKTSWNGVRVRTRLLSQQGIDLPDEIPELHVAGIADVLDAASAAWSADRIARGLARSLPDPPEDINSRQVAIWL